MKKHIKFFALPLLALLLTGCDFSFFESLISGLLDSTQESVDRSIPSTDGLMVYEGDGSNYGGYDYQPANAQEGYALAEPSKYTIEDIGASTWELEFPSKGTQRLLVIPVAFTDYARYKTDAIREDIYATFFGKPEETGWESLSSFYYKSSFHQLNIQGVVSEWYDSGMSTSQFAALSDASHSNYDPTWTMLEDAVKWYKANYNTKGLEFDNNNDGFLDGVWLVYGAPNYTNDTRLDSDVFWAYTFYDASVFDHIRYQSDLDGLKKNPAPYHYCWASFDHMYEGYGKSRVDAHTYIHETGHLMGLPDYYVASSTDAYKTNYGPMGCVDMMDANVIDHNAYSKMSYGWVTPYVPETSCTITLHPSASTGECLILPTSGGWNGTPFDEYMLLEFYTPTELNYSDARTTYTNGVRGFTTPGIRLFHVDSRMVLLNNEYEPTSYIDRFDAATQAVDIANDNTAAYNLYTSKIGNIRHRLIQLIDCEGKENYDTSYTYQQGQKIGKVATNGVLFTKGKSFSFDAYKDSFPEYHFSNKSQMNDGTTLPWSFRVSSIDANGATIEITKA